VGKSAYDESVIKYPGKRTKMEIKETFFMNLHLKDKLGVEFI